MTAVFLSVLAEEERNAFESFYNDNYTKLYSVAFGYLHSSHEAEDAVHETFMRIISAPDKFLELSESKKLSFAYIVVRNVSVDMYKKLNKEISIPPDEFSFEDMFTPSAEHTAVGNISRDELLVFISRMPHIYRDALTLRISHRLSGAQAARCLGISESAVRKRISDAVMMIKKYMEGGK